MYWFDVYIYNISVPSYLTDILPPRISETTNYPLGNSEDFTIRSYRLTLINSSFFPSTLRAWNSLDLENINASSYINLKRQLVNKTLVPVGILPVYENETLFTLNYVIIIVPVFLPTIYSDLI